MEIKTITSELIMENTYIVKRESDIIVIDPGCSPEQLHSQISNFKSQIKYVLLTHGHYDHTAALGNFDKSTIYAHIDEKSLIEDPEYNMSAYAGKPVKYTGINYYTGKKHEMDGIEFFHVPGHTAGGVLINIEGALFTGDTLFADTVGRTDIPTGSSKNLRKSLEIFNSFDKNIICYPGHGPRFSLAKAFNSNFYLKKS